jgi:hypothetical protein
MIKVSILSGPYTGQTREIPASIPPEELLGELLNQGWDWSVDYSQATEEEIFLWFREDLSCRVVRALRAGRSVRFLGKEYRVKVPTDQSELMDVVGQVEDAIVESGRRVSIEKDDEAGLVVSDEGFE